MKNSSAEAVAKMLRGDNPGVPVLMIPAVDIRDVAEAHWRALHVDLKGNTYERIILA